MGDLGVEVCRMTGKFVAVEHDREPIMADCTPGTSASGIRVVDLGVIFRW